jgi:hypothetical protein
VQLLEVGEQVLAHARPQPTLGVEALVKVREVKPAERAHARVLSVPSAACGAVQGVLVRLPGEPAAIRRACTRPRAIRRGSCAAAGGALTTLDTRRRLPAAPRVVALSGLGRGVALEPCSRHRVLARPMAVAPPRGPARPARARACAHPGARGSGSTCPPEQRRDRLPRGAAAPRCTPAGPRRRQGRRRRRRRPPRARAHSAPAPRARCPRARRRRCSRRGSARLHAGAHRGRACWWCRRRPTPRSAGAKKAATARRRRRAGRRGRSRRRTGRSRCAGCRTARSG